jgi:hypothetical protein
MTEQPDTGTRSPTPSVWHISRIPGHLGRARTSTVVLAVLFVAIFALYLYIRPDTPGPVPTTGTGNQVPVATTAPAQRTAAPTTTAEPTQEQPSTTDTATPTDVPTDTSTAELPTTSTTPSPTSTLPTPTLSSPTG